MVELLLLAPEDSVENVSDDATLHLDRPIGVTTVVINGQIYAIAGQPPSLIDPPVGCRFAPRCQRRTAKCDAEYPPEVEVSPGHVAACWHPGPGVAA